MGRPQGLYAAWTGHQKWGGMCTELTGRRSHWTLIETVALLCVGPSTTSPPRRVGAMRMFAGCMLSGKVDQGGNLACAGDAVRVWQLETTADRQSKEAPSHTLMPEADESKDGMPNAEVWRVRWNVTGTVLASSGATVRIRATHRGPTSPLWHIIWGWADRRRWQSTSLEAFICYGRVCASTRRLGMKWNP
eukprot:COSAG01_NODE_30771_length_609_cov_26.137255_1_plen_190_part_10